MLKTLDNKKGLSRDREPSDDLCSEVLDKLENISSDDSTDYDSSDYSQNFSDFSDNFEKEKSLDISQSEDILGKKSTGNKRQTDRKSLDQNLANGNSNTEIYLKRQRTEIADTTTKKPLKRNTNLNTKINLKRQTQIRSSQNELIGHYTIPIGCALCNLWFTWPDELESHMSTHTGVPPYHSPQTNTLIRDTKGFSVPNSESLIQCKECPKSFSRADMLRCHMIKDHKYEEDRPSKKSQSPKQEYDVFKLQNKKKRHLNCDEEHLGDLETQFEKPSLDKLQIGLENCQDSSDKLQIGLENCQDSSDKLQIGLENYQDLSDKLQIGLKNYQDSSDKLQIGLENYQDSSDDSSNDDVVSILSYPESLTNLECGERMETEDKDQKVNAENKLVTVDRPIGLGRNCNTEEIISSLNITECFSCLECGERFEVKEELEAHKKMHLDDLAPVKSTENVDQILNNVDELRTTNVRKHLETHSSYQVKHPDQNTKHPEKKGKHPDKKGKQPDKKTEEESISGDDNLQDDFDSDTEIEDLEHSNNMSFDSDSEIGERCDYRTKTEEEDDGLDDSQEQFLNCSECDQYFSKIKDLQDHKEIHHAEDLLKAPTTRFPENSTVPENSIVEESFIGIKCFSCLECGDMFTQRDNLQHHKKTHETPCILTDNSVNSPIKENSDFTKRKVAASSSEKHQNLAPEIVDNKRFRCALCQESFTKKRALTEHIRTHKTADNRYVCTHCGKCYKNKVHLQRHTLTHTGVKPFACGKCEERFYRKDLLKYHDKMQHSGTKPSKPALKPCSLCGKRVRNLEAHMDWHSGVKRFACTQCEKRFLTQSQLKVHMDKHAGIRPSTQNLCTTCGKSIADNSAFKRHMENHAGIKAFPCSDCDKGFTKRRNLDAHMASKHTGSTPYKCDDCGKGFALLERLKTHVQTHTGIKAFPCETCGKKFATRMTRDAHLSQHTGYRPHICEKCGKGFVLLERLTKHMETHVDETSVAEQRWPKKHVCTECERGFKWQSQLDEHMLQHTGERPHQCSVCGNRYARKSHLKSHMITHLSHTEKHACESCDKRFGSTYILKQHCMRMHSINNLKPHPCSLCEKTFLFQSELRRHLQGHSGIRAYPCEMCDKRFIFQAELNKHMKVHSDFKPFACSECDKRFPFEKYLRNHMWIHTGKAFSCSVCCKSFALEKSVRRHMLKQH